VQPHFAEIHLGLSPGIKQQPDVCGPFLALEDGGKGVHAHMDDAIVLAERTSDHGLNGAAMGKIVAIDELLALLAREPTGKLRKEFGADRAVGLHDQSRNRVGKERRAGLARDGACDIDRARIPPEM
jgi:hypothetical protein